MVTPTFRFYLVSIFGFSSRISSGAIEKDDSAIDIIIGIIDEIIAGIIDGVNVKTTATYIARVYGRRMIAPSTSSSGSSTR